MKKYYLPIPFFFAACKLLIHLYINVFGGYGYFRDEFYYIACSNNLAAGYVDHPPFSIFVLAVYKFIVGDSIFALRLLPALCGVATVYITGLIVRELGGGKYAQLFACLGVALAPVYLGINSNYSMNSFDMVFWVSSTYLLVRLINTKQPVYWYYLGVLLGLGLMNKIGVLWLGAGITIGLLCTPHRRWFKTKYPWIAGGIALVLFSPFIIWNITHDLAHLEFIKNATSEKYSGLSRLTFMKDVLKEQNPFSIIIWGSGLFWLLFSERGKQYRMLGLIFVTTFGILILNEHSKAEYISASFPILFAGGGMAIEKYFAKLFTRWLMIMYALLLILTAIIIMPLAVPILPIETYIRYQDFLHVAPSTAEGKKLSKLPQHYADRFGWENVETTVASVYRSLTPEEQSACLIYVQNYGEAGALQFFGRKDHLPPVCSGHNNYWFWGTHNTTGELVIVVGGREEDHLRSFETVEQKATIVSEYAMPYENNLPVYICRKLKIPINEAWQKSKHFD